jgi:hypothetical protein
MDRAEVLDEIAAVARRLSALIHTNREATQDHDFDFSHRLRAEIVRLQELREQLLGKPPKPMPRADRR